jgi:hypothetical protein
MTALHCSALSLLVLGMNVAPIEAASTKPKKPKLEIRLAPSMASAPVEVTVFIDLRGGEDLEEFYCPEIAVDWDDGSKSVQESDCAPFEPGSVVTRHFSVSHPYRQGGLYRVRVRLRRAGKTVASEEQTATIRAGIGEFQ